MLSNQSRANSRTRASQRGGDKSRTLYRPENEQYLFQQSNSFLNLEQLVQVLNAFEGWQATIANKPR